MRKLIVIALVIVCGLALLAEFGVYRICDGAFPLNVDVVSDDPPNRVSAQVHRHHDEAIGAAERMPLNDDLRRVITADPFRGQTIELLVECSHRDTVFGRQTQWSQAESLLVVGEWDDGRRVAKVVELPDGRTTRTLRVELP